MFKFARHFFIIFIITTIFPLVLMLFWGHHRMEQVMHDKKAHFLSFGMNELKLATEHYLNIKESLFLEKILDLMAKKISFADLKSCYKNEKIEFIIGKKLNKVESYYESVKDKSSPDYGFYSVIVVPCNIQGISGIKLAEKVDINDFHHIGPFNIELFLGDKADRNSFYMTAEDPLAQLLVHKNKPNFSKFKNKPESQNIVKILNNKGQTVAMLVLSPIDIAMQAPRPGFGPPPPPGNFDKNGKEGFSEPPHDDFAMPSSQPPHPPGLGFPFPPFAGGPNLELIILLAGCVFSLSMGFYLSKNFINPLLILSNALKQVQQGNISFELDAKIRQEEIQKIFNDFNQMVKSLKEKEMLRKNFIANLTHDLKTPLIAQERSLGLISKEFEDLGMKKAYELAIGIQKNNQHLLRMVDLILESYRFDSGKLNIIISDVNLFELVDNCYEKLNSLAQEKNIELVNSILKDFQFIKADITSIKRVFLNLISNSIDCITKNGKIKISAEHNNDFIKLIVEDNGPGISENEIQYIFERNYTGKSGERKLGSGLGLYVCKKLVEMHNGEITVESEVNKYSRFIIKLPVNLNLIEDENNDN